MVTIVISALAATGFATCSAITFSLLRAAWSRQVARRRSSRLA